MKTIKPASGRIAQDVVGDKSSTVRSKGIDEESKLVACDHIVEAKPFDPNLWEHRLPQMLIEGTLDSAIDWTHLTINWWMGCAKVSEGCRNCYAEAQCKAYGHAIWGPQAQRVQVGSAIKEARQANRAAGEKGCKDLVFCCSLADFFEERPEVVGWRREAWEVIRDCPNLIFIILTKRPENIARMLPADWGETGYANVCLAATVENSAVIGRIDELRAVPARWRMLSVEPLIGPVDLSGRLEGIHWVIVGGESGKQADPKVIRPLQPEWVRAVRDACLEQNVPCFFKQWGAWLTEKPPSVAKPTTIQWHGLTMYFKAPDNKNKLPAVIDGQTWRQHPFGSEVDLDRLSAVSRFKAEKAAAKVVAELTPEHEEEFNRLHRIVITGYQSMFEAGEAFDRIRTQKLWRAGGHHSWEDYLEALGGVSRSHANRLIAAWEIRSKLEDTAPIGADGNRILPLAESQTRALSRLPDPDIRGQAWERAVTKSKGKVPTANAVIEVVCEILAEDDEGRPDPGPDPTSTPREGDAGSGRDQRTVLHTIGLTGKSAEQFFGLLRANGVRRVIDVRSGDDDQLAGFAKGGDLSFLLREILHVEFHKLPESPVAGEDRLPPEWIEGGCLLGSDASHEACRRRAIAENLPECGVSVEIIHLV